MNLKYTYIAVLLKAFFSHCNALGKVEMDKLISYFDSYYNERLINGLLSEKSNSVLGRRGFTERDIKHIILFNPLKRSFLSNYFKYIKSQDMVVINESLWDTLTNSDKSEIILICDNKLEEYFSKLT